MISDDDVVEPEAEAERTPADGSDARTAGGTRRGVLVPAVLLTLLAAAIALAIVQTGRASDAADERDALDAAARDRQAATLVAAQFAEAFFTYDFEDVDASTEAVLGLVTEEYAEDFQSENVPGLQDLFGDVALVSTGRADQVVVGEVDGDTARGLARVDIDTSVQGVDRTLADLTLSIVLRRQGDAWKVDEVTIVQAHPEGDDLPAPPEDDPTTTTTAAPPPG